MNKVILQNKNIDLFTEAVEYFECSNNKTCGDATHIRIPKGTTKIDRNTFRGNKNLISVIIPKGVSFINDHAFSGCSNLVSIEIPDTITSIGRFSFLNCKKLDNVNIPKSVKTIGQFAFLYCSSLKSITIPDNIIIGFQAFRKSGCPENMYKKNTVLNNCDVSFKHTNNDTNNDTNTNTNQTNQTGIIVGSVVGGIVLVGLGYYLYNRYRMNE
jgi:hypothetical protein